MKKSKFLKKSLAMLLALMLVVAMIPLSAAAATPELREVRMSTDGTNWGPPLEASGSTYTGSYDSNASEISLQAGSTDGQHRVLHQQGDQRSGG